MVCELCVCKNIVNGEQLEIFIFPLCRTCVPSVVHSVAVGHVLCGYARSAENSERWVLYISEQLKK